ncbi:MAG TPA: GAF domain-containing protein [Anaerolineales bacterium]|nr:GAF domain-containing protein [Anaerolineales bacterium]
MPDDETRSSLDLLYNVSRELASALDLRTVLQRILFESLKYVGGERGSIVVMDDNGKPVESAIVYGRKIHDHTTQQLRETVERGLAGWVVRKRQPAWVPDTSKDERWLRRPDDAVDQSGAKAAMCVPLLARERLVGVLTLVHPVPGSYNKDHFNLMQAIADLSGIAVLNARLYAESQRQARVMTALAASAAAINASLRLDEVLQRILNESIAALQVETVTLALVEPNWDLLFRAATGTNKDKIVGKRIPAGQGVVGWVVHEGEGVVIPVVKEDKRFMPGVEQFEGLEAHAMAVAPIYAQGRVIGVLQAINPWSGSFDPDALLVLAGIGNLAGSTIQHAQLFERLQTAHKRYRELFDDSVDPIFVTNWNGQIHEANRQAALISGMTSKQLQGMLIDQLHEVTRGEKNINVDRLKAGETLSYEALLLSKTGRKIPIQVQVRRMVFEEAESLQWLMRDITERKDLDTLREDMTSMIYHDLRSPLANIVSSLDLLTALGSGEENETISSVVTIARRATDRIQRLVSSLLDINRLESGQAIVSQQSVTPDMLAEDAVEAVRPMAESRHQVLTKHLPQKLPAVWVDVDMIRRVLINLMENASKFTPPEGKIELGGKLENDCVQLWVQDTGPGIPFADRERIFDKFTRLKTEGAVSGLGVGLAFCRLAVEGHGGKIRVESETGQGARFVFTLPLAKEN